MHACIASLCSLLAHWHAAKGKVVNCMAVRQCDYCTEGSCRCCNCCWAVVKRKRSAATWWQSAWATWLCSSPARRCPCCSIKVRCAAQPAMTTHHPKRGAWYGLVTLCMAASCASVTPYAACLLHDQDTVTAAHNCVVDVCHHVQADHSSLSGSM